MLVRTTAKGHASAALHVGARNVQKYFGGHSSVVALELDHLCIDCVLPPEFWQGDPEIHDPRLSEWLRFKVLKGTSVQASGSLQMIPAGENCFRLVPRKSVRPSVH